MRVLLICYCNGSGPNGEDDETIFVAATAPGPFGITDEAVSQCLAQTVSVQAITPLPEEGDFFRHEDGYTPILLEAPDPDTEEHMPIPSITLLEEGEG